MCEQIEGGFTRGFPGGNVYYCVHRFVEQDKTFSPKCSTHNCHALHGHLNNGWVYEK